jgi:hypothetical protein
MFRRTDCHFSLSLSDMDAARYQYVPVMTQLLQGEQGRVFLDVERPRVCLRGNEAEGYPVLGNADVFSFYELRAAADDLRGGRAFDAPSMRAKIAAQVATLVAHRVRHVVLLPFGCGAFLNPPELVAQLYKEELMRERGQFEHVVFAVFHAGYGSDNYPVFRDVLCSDG